ncbi:hypothetical protein H0H93_000995 [Arthromyces matolae]|nr:hypothetical protein H0H93_000995 [Arthromyces matolae]
MAGTPNSIKSVYFDAPMHPQEISSFSSQPPRIFDTTTPSKQEISGAPASDVMKKDTFQTISSPKQEEGSGIPPPDDHVIYRPESPSGWLPAVDLPPEETQPRILSPLPENGGQVGNMTNLQSENPPRRAVSMLSPSGSRRGMVSPIAQRRVLSVRSPSPAPGSAVHGNLDRPVRRRRSMFTRSTGEPIEGSIFIGGAATTGPHSTADHNHELAARAAQAEANLSRKEMAKIKKSEAEDGKLLSKIILDEGRAEKQALSLAIHELAMCQKDQANAIEVRSKAYNLEHRSDLFAKNEARTHEQRKKLQAECQKQETQFLEARAKFEAAQARVHSEEETLEMVREKARDATERLQEKSQEVDSLRTMFSVDERERAAKLAAINGKATRAKGGGCIIA